MHVLILGSTKWDQRFARPREGRTSISIWTRDLALYNRPAPPVLCDYVLQYLGYARSSGFAWQACTRSAFWELCTCCHAIIVFLRVYSSHKQISAAPRDTGHDPHPKPNNLKLLRPFRATEQWIFEAWKHFYTADNGNGIHGRLDTRASFQKEQNARKSKYAEFWIY